MHICMNKTMKEWTEGCQGRFHRGGDTRTSLRRISWNLSGWQDGEAFWRLTDSTHKRRQETYMNRTVSLKYLTPKVNHQLGNRARLQRGQMVSALFSLSYFYIKTNKRSSKKGWRRKKKSRSRNSSPKPILIPVECRKLSAAALEESLGSHWSLTSPPQHPRSPLIFDARFHAVFRGDVFYLKDTLEENSLAHPLGWTHRGSEANPRTDESPKQTSPCVHLNHSVPSSALWGRGCIPHGVFLRNKHLLEHKYY